jgi:hypothetical protein
VNRDEFDNECLKHSRISTAINGSWEVLNVVETFELDNAELDMFLFQSELILKELKKIKKERKKKK